VKRIVILISGRGSTMQSLAQACGRDGWQAQVVAVISNRPDVAGLGLAQSLGLGVQVVDHRAYALREGFDEALIEAIDRYQPDAVLMAGFMRIMGAAFAAHYAGRMLNIHPSLLPSFAGLRTHQRALDAGCTVAGSTVHFVSAALDGGPIVLQAVVPVRADDSAATLSARVLQQEHVIYPRAARWLTEGRLRIEGERVRQLDGQAQWVFA
jgi:phosphoribosylglycinamide formyltransferase 1